MQDLLTASVVFIAIAFSTLVVFDLAVNLAALWNQSQPQPEFLPTPEHDLPCWDDAGRDFIDYPHMPYSEWLAMDLEDADRWDGTPYQEPTIADPWTLPTEEVIAAAPSPLAKFPTNLLLLPPAKELPVVQKTKRARSQKVQTEVQKHVETVAPKRRGRPRKTA